ncbi:MAG: hypothetical protein AABZ44_07865, partial [Elusimicrobiota bacterium]
TSCRWVGGTGVGMECEDSTGSGFSTSCDLSPDLCQSGLGGQTKAPATDAVKPAQVKAAASPATTQYQGMSCTVTDGYFMCEDPAKPGSGFGGKCSSTPQACASAGTGQEPLPATEPEAQSDGAYTPYSDTPTQAQSDGDGIADDASDDSASAPLGNVMQPPKEDLEIAADETSDASGLADSFEGIGLPQGQGDLSEQLMALSESQLRDMESKVGDFGKEIGNLPRNATVSSRKAFHGIQLAVWDAIARKISRDHVFSRLPSRYYSDSGIYEKPEVTMELHLIAEDGMPALLRDASLADECYGLPTGKSVRHVDMIKQCSDLYFEKNRRFRL